MKVNRTDNSIILEELTPEEQDFFEDKINYWEYLQEQKRSAERFEEIMRKIAESEA